MRQGVYGVGREVGGGGGKCTGGLPVHWHRLRTGVLTREQSGRDEREVRAGRVQGRRRHGRRGSTVTAARQDVRDARRIVVKIGSSSLTTAAGGLDADRVDALVDVLVKQDGKQIVLVSSGAI